MEILVSVSNIKRLERIINNADGVLMAGEFSERVSFSRQILKESYDLTKSYHKKFYLSIDAVISESNKSELYTYLEWVKDLNPDGIYFTDFGVLKIAEEYGMKDKMIYDGGPLMTNTLDAEVLLKMGIDGVVLARELSLEEDIEIIKRHKGLLDMQIFGHLKMSTSKRRFLTNYFKYIDKEADIVGNEFLTLEEENRKNQRMPIVEDENGTRIYTNFILEAYEELPYLKLLLKRGIIEDRFIGDGLLFDIIRDYNRITDKNASFLKNSLLKKYQDIYFSSGYFYLKTTLDKNEKEG